jgi:hypothetical protein
VRRRWHVPIVLCVGDPLKKTKFDFCWGCGALTALRCARCKKPVCVVFGSPVPAVGCAQLRKSPRDVGVYLLVCTPRCRLRRTPQVLAIVEKHRAPRDPSDTAKLRSQLDDALFAATSGHKKGCECSWCEALAKRLAEIPD